MKGIKLLGTIGLISAIALNLGACGKSNNTQSSTTDVKNFKSAVPTKTAKKGGVVKVAIETDTPFSGIFNYELSTNTKVQQRSRLIQKLRRPLLILKKMLNGQMANPSQLKIMNMLTKSLLIKT